MTTTRIPELIPIKNLAFDGGGPACVAYGGVIDQLKKEPTFSFDTVERIAGTSSGSITALLICLGGIKERDIVTYSLDFDIGKLTGEDECLFTSYLRLKKNYGIRENTFLLEFIEEILEEKTGNRYFTFGELKERFGKSLYIITTLAYGPEDQPTMEPFVFSHENAAHTPIAFAILASTALPSYFECVRMQEKKPGLFVLVPDSEKNAHCFIDGGVFSTAVPVKLFDHPRFLQEREEKYGNNLELPSPFISVLPEKANTTATTEIKCVNPYTLGFQLIDQDKKQEKAKTQFLPQNKPWVLANAIINGISFKQREHLLDENDLKRMVNVDRLRVNSSDFHVNKRKKAELILSGRKAIVDKFKVRNEIYKKNLARPVRPTPVAIKSCSDKLALFHFRPRDVVARNPSFEPPQESKANSRDDANNNSPSR